MAFGIVLSLSIREPEDLSPPAQGLRATLLTPFTEYFHRVGLRAGALALLFMVAYKLGDNMATALATPFYLDMGFSMTEIGLVAKHAALWPAIVGGLLGGFAMLRLGINRALWIFGLIQMLSILGFAWLASGGTELWQLALVIAFEYLGVVWVPPRSPPLLPENRVKRLLRRSSPCLPRWPRCRGPWQTR